MTTRAKRTPKPSQPLKWHGGKSYLARWIRRLAPPSVTEDKMNGYSHRNLAFAGGLGEFWDWPHEGVAEAVNDINGELTNFYAVLRDKKLFDEFQRLVNLTPLSDEVWRQACEEKPVGNVERAWAFFIRFRMSRQGLGRDYTTPTKRTRRGMNEQVSAWLSAVEGLTECHERLRRVEVTSQDFRKFVPQRDHERALLYLDPPYVASTRSSGGEYGEHEMSEADHEDLLEILVNLKGRFMLSGYRSPLYDAWADKHGFTRHEKTIDNKASSAKTKAKRTECLWLNYDVAAPSGAT